MKAPLLDRHERDFDERNGFIPLMLGMVTGARRLLRCIPEPTLHIVSAAERRNPDPDEDDACLAFLLGLTSFSTRLLRTVDRAAPSIPEATAAPDPVEVSPTALPRNLLF